MTGEFTDEVINLDPEVFNLPLRRDIIHNVSVYWQKYGKILYNRAKGFGDVRGTGRKPTPQKGQGAARQGNRRAPQRAGGGVAHGPVPRDLTFPMNNKVRLLALKTMLSAKLYEDKLIFIDSEQIELPKTQLLDEIISPFKKDKLCFLTSQDIDENFKRASSNINLLHVKHA